MESYAYTVKDNRSDDTDYLEFFERIEKKGCKALSKCPEKDSRGRLHYHGIIQIPKSCFRKTLVPQGLHMKLKKIFDEEGWEHYIKKDQDGDDIDTNDNGLIKKLTKKLF